MDEIDRAQFRDAQYLEDCERERKYQAAKAALVATGECRYCGEPVAGEKRFCDADCRDAWDYEHKLKRMQGVK